jgi:hypothetical protein
LSLVKITDESFLVLHPLNLCGYALQTNLLVLPHKIVPRLTSWNIALEKPTVAQLVEISSVFRRTRSVKIPPLASVLTQMNAVLSFSPYFFKIHFHISVPPIPRSPKCISLFSE